MEILFKTILTFLLKKIHCTCFFISKEIQALLTLQKSWFMKKKPETVNSERSFCQNPVKCLSFDIDRWNWWCFNTRSYFFCFQKFPSRVHCLFIVMNAHEQRNIPTWNRCERKQSTAVWSHVKMVSRLSRNCGAFLWTFSLCSETLNLPRLGHIFLVAPSTWLSE